MLSNGVENKKIGKGKKFNFIIFGKCVRNLAQKHFEMSLINFTSTYLRNFTHFYIFIFDLQTYRIISQFEMYTQLSNCNFVLKNCLFC